VKPAVQWALLLWHPSDQRQYPVGDPRQTARLNLHVASGHVRLLQPIAVPINRTDPRGTGRTSGAVTVFLASGRTIYGLGDSRTWRRPDSEIDPGLLQLATTALCPVDLLGATAPLLATFADVVLNYGPGNFDDQGGLQPRKEHLWWARILGVRRCERSELLHRKVPDCHS